MDVVHTIEYMSAVWERAGAHGDWRVQTAAQADLRAVVHL